MASRSVRTTSSVSVPDAVEARVYLAPTDRTLSIKAQPDLGLSWIKQTARMNAIPSGAVDAYTADSPGLHAKATGAALWNTLLSGSLALALGQATRACDAAGRPVTLRLVPDADVTDDVWRQPWELLVDPKTNDFFALAAGRSIVRGAGTGPDPRPLPTDRPLLIDVIVTYPAQLPPLSGAQHELAWMTDVLPGLGPCVVRPVPVTTDADVLHRLTTTDADVVHLICAGRDGWHVGPDFTAPTSSVLERDALMAQTEQWIEVLEQSSIALVVLNGCAVDATARRLAESGLSVVGHRGQVLDEHAAFFTEAFYPQVVSRLPLDAVMTETRRGLERRFPGAMAWGSALFFTSWPPLRLGYATPSTGRSVDSTAAAEPFDPASLQGDAADELLKVMVERNKERLVAQGAMWDLGWQPVDEQLKLLPPDPGGSR